MITKAQIHVIMPVYNCEKYIISAVDSIVNQPYNNLNIIIVDDGSTDNSPTICDSLANKCTNIKVIHTENLGVSSARNTAIDYIIDNSDIDNSYIAFCDADDLWAKDCLPADLDSYLYEDIICFGSCYMSNDASKISNPHGCLRDEIFSGGKKTIWTFPFHFGAFLYKASLFKTYNIKFDISLKYNEDKILLMQMLYLAESVRSIPRMLYLYRKNPFSSMHKRPHGIDYYLPLIDGWMRSDDKMKSFANDTRETLTAGYVLACIYVVEMSKEHYWYNGNSKELYKVIEHHPIYPYFSILNPLDVSKKQFKEYTFFTKHPKLFKIKHNMYGLLIRTLKFLLNTKPFAKWMYSRQFTFDNNY